MPHLSFSLIPVSLVIAKQAANLDAPEIIFPNFQETSITLKRTVRV
jgi:hypothetical protein